MEQLVRVREVYEDGTAQVLCIRESACSGDCHKCAGCGAVQETMAPENAVIEDVTVQNDVIKD